MKTPTFLANMSAKTEKRILWAIAAVLVMAVIFAFSSQASFASEETSDALADLLSMEQQDLQTRVSNQSIIFGLTLRKLAHIFLFAALGFCLYQALMDVKRRLVIAVGAAYLYGVLDEIHQSLAGRYGRWQDTLIDLIGIALGLAAALLLPKLNTLCKKWFYEDWDTKHPVAKKRLEWCLDALSLAAVMQYVGYRFLQTTMFEFIYSERYKTLTFLSLLVFGGVRFVYYFARKLWADADEKAQIRRFLKFVGVCVLALPFFIVAYLHDYKVLIFIPICWMCLYDIQAELVFKWYVRVIGIMLGATVLCCLAGVVKNICWFTTKGFVQSYGFINTTDFAAYFIFLGLFGWCAKKRDSWHFDVITAVLMVTSGAYVYSLTGSRTTFICCVLAAFVCLWDCLCRTGLFKCSWTEWPSKTACAIAICTFPVMLITMALLTYLRGQENSWALQLDVFLSRRLHLAWQVYEKYGIHLLGNAFDMHGIGGSLIRDWRGYDFLDSSYEYLLIRDGLLFTAVIMGQWVWMTLRASRKNNKGAAFSMAVIAIYAFSESHFMDISYNILLAMPFCSFTASSVVRKDEGQKIHANKDLPHVVMWFGCITAIFLATLGYLILPKSLSWLRTIFSLLHWNSGTQTLSAFYICAAILIILYMIWKLLNRIHYHRNKSSSILLVSVITLMVSMILIGNSVINRGLVEQQESLNAEEEVIQLVLDSAQKPVYALERVELYQRSIGGITEKIMSPEDILHNCEGTILTDIHHELPVVMNNGAQYLQLTDSSIYSFDPYVINALSAAGYEWKGFYSTERLCYLKDLALLNRLDIDNKGSLILQGSRHSLSENRYLDQYAGDYEVRYAMHMDLVSEHIDSVELICTLKVMGFKGEEVIITQDVFASEFDEDGHCVVTIPYSLSVVPRIEYLVIAADGVTLYVDEIAWRRVA